MISIIVAIAENNAIGKNNQLLWHLPEDLKRFKKLTTGHTIIMGRNTYVSLPVQPLPNRSNVVISDVEGEQFPSCIMAASVEEVIQKHCTPESESFVIGGAMVYQQFLNLADKLYITLVHQEFEADAFFPKIKKEDWILAESLFHPKDEMHPYDFSFHTYLRKK
jgi:dihydrofolate reductase